MRTFLLALSLSLALPGAADAATRNFGIADFTKVRVDAPFKVVLSTGVAPFAKATGSSAALDRVDIQVQGNTLIVRSASSWGGYPDENPGPVEVSIGTHELNSAWVNGAGSLMVDRVRGLNFAATVQGSGRIEISSADTDQMTVGLAGSGSAKLAGRAKQLTAVIRGIGALDAASLSANDATIGAQGAATVDANVTDSATVDAVGPATIRLAGRPACKLKVSGSTDVSGCK